MTHMDHSPDMLMQYIAIFTAIDEEMHVHDSTCGLVLTVEDITAIGRTGLKWAGSPINWKARNQLSDTLERRRHCY